MKTKATYWLKIEGDLERNDLILGRILDMFDEYFSACKVEIKELEVERMV